MENRVTAYLKEKQLDLPVLFTGEDTSTVAKAAAVLGVEEGRIAKSLAFRLKDGSFCHELGKGSEFRFTIPLDKH